MAAPGFKPGGSGSIATLCHLLIRQDTRVTLESSGELSPISAPKGMRTPCFKYSTAEDELSCLQVELDLQESVEHYACSDPGSGGQSCDPGPQQAAHRQEQQPCSPLCPELQEMGQLSPGDRQMEAKGRSSYVIPGNPLGAQWRQQPRRGRGW